MKLGGLKDFAAGFTANTEKFKGKAAELAASPKVAEFRANHAGVEAKAREVAEQAQTRAQEVAARIQAEVASRTQTGNDIEG